MFPIGRYLFLFIYFIRHYSYATHFFQVGKYMGEPVYKTVDKDEFHNPILMEYYAHAPYMDMFKKAYEAHIQAWT